MRKCINKSTYRFPKVRKQGDLYALKTVVVKQASKPAGLLQLAHNDIMTLRKFIGIQLYLGRQVVVKCCN